MWLPLSNYSFDVSLGERYGRKPALGRPEEGFRQWSAKEVANYLRAKGLSEEAVATLEREEIDGVCAKELDGSRDAITELLPRMADRLKLMAILSNLTDMASDRDFEPIQTDQIELTCRGGSSSVNVSLLTSLCRKERIARATIVRYSGAALDRWGNEDDNLRIPGLSDGVPLVMIDMHRITVASVSFALDSEGATVSINPQSIICTTRGFGDFAGLSTQAQAAWMPPGSEERIENDLEHNAMGVSVAIDFSTNQTSTCEFGPYMRWSTKTHRLFPREFRNVVTCILMLIRRGGGEKNPFAFINKDIAFKLITMIQFNIKVDPFLELPESPIRVAYRAPKKELPGGFSSEEDELSFMNSEEM